MRVMVKLKEFPGALENRSRRTARLPKKVLDIISSLGLAMQPLHPDAADAGLRSYYTVEVPDLQTAYGLIDRLAESKMVDGAYIKPADALP